MPRTVVGYVNPFLNKMASASSTGSVEVITGAPIATGVSVGDFQEYSDAAAALYSSKQVVSIQILTAGSGQTPGTYTVNASTGGAQISVVVAAGGTVTAIPTIVLGGKYTVDTAPTFTLTGAGGTAATFSATLGFLYSGTYEWVQLDPAVTGSIKVGQPLYWLQSAITPTVTTVATANFPDFAGVSIDPGFSATAPYAYIQINGKAKALFDSTVAVIGDIVNLASTPGATVTAVNTSNPNGAVTNLTIGTALVAGTTLTPSLVRIERPVTRF